MVFGVLEVVSTVTGAVGGWNTAVWGVRKLAAARRRAKEVRANAKALRAGVKYARAAYKEIKDGDNTKIKAVIDKIKAALEEDEKTGEKVSPVV